MRIPFAYLHLAGLFISLTGLTPISQDELYLARDGYIELVSEAPLELINAESHELNGVINATTGGVAFSVRVDSFHGFNSLLQREHFLENYMEATKYPVATFTGKLIEKVNFTAHTAHNVRVKGFLNIHGVKVERIIQGTLVTDGNTASLKAAMTVQPVQHDIQIPKIFSQKIAETVSVTIEMTMLKQP